MPAPTGWFGIAKAVLTERSSRTERRTCQGATLGRRRTRAQDLTALWWRDSSKEASRRLLSASRVPRVSLSPGTPGALLRPAPLRTGYVQFHITGCMSRARLC